MLKLIKKKIKSLIKPVVVTDINKTDVLVENILLQQGKIWSDTIKKSKFDRIEDAEFKVFSQWGDDGIIQYLINNVEIANKTFIEFGVEDYLESNTRFLLYNNNWSGLIMDGSAAHMNKVRKSDYYWKYDVIAKEAFINAENINDLIEEEGFEKEVGLLHIDIDGNDYWIWDAINVIEPVIIIVEFNSVFGKERAITVPYRSDFNRSKAHYSNLYAGASLPALYHLAQEKGYNFVGCNSAGNNAYFIKKNKMGNLKPLSLEEGFVKSKFRESRDINGNLDFLKGSQRLQALKGLPIFNTITNKLEEL